MINGSCSPVPARTIPMPGIPPYLFLLALGLTFVTAVQRVTFDSENLFPSGIAFDYDSYKFVITSRTTGRISSVDDQGNFSTVIDNPLLKATTGILFDPEHLYICNTDLDATPPTAEVVVFDRKNWTHLWSVDIGLNQPGGNTIPHFCSDLTQDAEGNLFVADSFQPAILRIAKNTQIAQLWAWYPVWTATVKKPGLQGITWTSRDTGRGKGTILVTHPKGVWNLGIDPDGNASIIVSQATWTGPEMKAMNSIKSIINGNLVATNGTSVCSISSSDVFHTLSVVACRHRSTAKVDWFIGAAFRISDGSALVNKNEHIFILNCHLDQLALSQNVTRYDIFRVEMRGIWLRYDWAKLMAVTLCASLILFLLIGSIIWWFTRDKDKNRVTIEKNYENL